MSGFNGAAVFRPRKLREDHGDSSPLDRFNGAAVFRPRKPSTSSRLVIGASTLQRSRGLSTAETRTMQDRTRGRWDASTEPRSFDRGNKNRTVWVKRRQLLLQRSRGLSTAETANRSFHGRPSSASLQRSRGLSTAETPHATGCRGNERNRFNGAAVFRPRKRRRGRPPRRAIHRASTEPRSFDRGNPSPEKPFMEPSPGFNGAAVFRPRKLRDFLGVLACLLLASTEPRSFDRGNSVQFLLDRGGRGRLQRSRGLSTAETLRLRPGWSL